MCAEAVVGEGAAPDAGEVFLGGGGLVDDVDVLDDVEAFKDFEELKQELPM